MNTPNTRCYDQAARWHTLVAFVALFTVNPICGILVTLVYIFYSQNDEACNFLYVVLSLFLAFWLGTINLTKFPTGDLPGYIRMFERVPQYGFHRTVFESWGGSGKEPFYSFITYVGYYVCLGNASLFFFLQTAVMYLLLFVSTIRFMGKIGGTKAEVLCGILSIAFFTQYFVLTTHIIRQMLAMSIVVYAVVDRVIRGKHNWALLVVATLTHTSAILIAAFSLIPYIYRRMALRRALILASCFIPFVLFNTQIGALIGVDTASGSNAVEYAASRYASDASDGIVIPIGLMLLVYVPLLIASARVLWLLRNLAEHAAYPIVYIFLLQVAFVLSFSQNSLVQYRFFYFSYAFIPLILPLMFYDRNREHARWYCAAVSLFFIVRFYLIHNTSGFHYAPMTELTLVPFPYYFLTPIYY